MEDKKRNFFEGPNVNKARNGIPKKIGGGNLHFDEDAHTNSINKLNASMKNRDWRNKHLRPITNALSKPMEQLPEQTKGDEQSAQGLHKIQDYASIAPSILGGAVDQSGIESLLKSIEKQDNLIAYGDVLEKLVKRKKDEQGNEIFDFDYGDFYILKEVKKHPEYSIEKLNELKQKAKYPQNRAAPLLKPKQKVIMERALRLNAAETYTESLMLSHPEFFTEAERKVLEAENSIFAIRSVSDFKIRDDLINKILSNTTLLGSDFAKIDWKRATARDVSDILKGKKGFLVKDEHIKGLLEVKLHNIEKIKKIKEHGKRKAERKGVKGELVERIGKEVLKDEDLSAATDVIGNDLKGLKMASKVVLGADELGYKTVRTTGKISGKGVASAAKIAGLNDVATIVEAAGKKYVGIENSVSDVAKAVKDTPKIVVKGTAKLTAKGIATAGQKISNTKLAKRIGSSRAGKQIGTVGKHLNIRYKAVREMTKNTKNVLLAPARGLSTATDFIKKKILFPIAVGGGILLVIELVVGFFAGMSSNNIGGGAIVSIILDDEEHFQNFQAKYDEQDATFQSQVNSIINSPAQTRNLRGETIGYGINTSDVTNSDGSKALEGQYQNGLHLGYYYDGNSATGISSNIEDILSAMAVIMSQDQSNHYEEALEFIEAAYKSSHSYTTQETDLYQCTNGCTFTRYYCNDWADDTWYPNSDLKYKPWTYGDYVKPTANQECPVCKADGLSYPEYAGCSVTGKCYHGGRMEGEEVSTNADDYDCYFEFEERDDEKASEYYTEYVKPSIVTSYPKSCPGGYNSKGVRRYVLKSDILAASGLDENCNNYEIITLTSVEIYENKNGHEREHTEECGYVAVCGGHDHYGCPDGHEIATCYGHTDLYMNVYVSSLNKLFEMGGVPITEKTNSVATDQLYGMSKEEFDKLTAEEQASVIEDYTNKLNGGAE